MTTLTTRREIIKTKKVICSEIANMQKAFYDEEMLNYYRSANEEHLYVEMFDCLTNEEKTYSTFHKIIGFDHSKIETFTNKLTKKLKALFKSINANNFIVISHLKLDFFGDRNNNFKPLNEAYHKLEKIVGSNTFKEAFEIDLLSLQNFIEILF